MSVQWTSQWINSNNTTNETDVHFEMEKFVGTGFCGYFIVEFHVFHTKLQQNVICNLAKFFFKKIPQQTT